MIGDGSHTYYYDAENRVIQVDGTSGQCSTAAACYVYNASRQRVTKTTSAGTVYYVSDIAGHQVAEFSSSGAWNRGEVYAGSKHLATYVGGTSGSTYLNLADWVGTERMRVNSKQSPQETCTSLPFGDMQSCTGTDESPMHFTGQQWDSEDNLTAFWFRTDSTTQGRWGSMDPSGLAAVDPSDPQTWNRYAYVMNNPLSFIDPTGLACWPFEKQRFGSCAPFMNNGVNFGANWNLFDLFMGWTSCESGDCQRFNIRNGLAFALAFGGTPAGNPSNNCVRPNLAQRAAINVLTKVANWTNKTVGYGFGGSYGLGFGQGFGFSGTASAQLQVSPGGNASLVYTYGGSGLTQDWLTPSSLGASLILGPQISVSNGPPSSGPGADIAASGVLSRTGLGPGASVDVNGSADGVTGTLTVGAGAGLASGSAVATQTAVVPFCSGG
jgi:RHS repeat-associated protein